MNGTNNVSENVANDGVTDDIMIWDDATWILGCSFVVFTMQTGKNYSLQNIEAPFVICTSFKPRGFVNVANATINIPVYLTGKSPFSVNLGYYVFFSPPTCTQKTQVVFSLV